MVNRHDWLVGVVVLVGLARVVFAGGVDRPSDVSATRAFAGDDENVMHLTLLSALVGLWAEPRDRVDDDGVRGGGVQLGVQHRLRDLVFAAPNMFGHKGSPAWCGSV